MSKRNHHLLSSFYRWIWRPGHEKAVGEDSEYDEVVEYLAGSNVDGTPAHWIPWWKNEKSTGRTEPMDVCFLESLRDDNKCL